MGNRWSVLARPELGADDAQQVLGIAAVVDGEVGRQADGLAPAAEQPGGDGMEGPPPDAAGKRAASRALGHGRSSARRSISAAARRVKVSSRILRRIDPVGDEPGHAVDQGGGLARCPPRPRSAAAPRWVAARRCSGLSRASRSSVKRAFGVWSIISFGIIRLRASGSKAVDWAGARLDALGGLVILEGVFRDPGEKGDRPHLYEAPFGPFRQNGACPLFPAPVGALL